MSSSLSAASATHEPGGREKEEAMIPREQWDRERLADGTFRVRCSVCAKSVSSPLAEPVIVRAWVVCPECIEAGWRIESDGAPR
jgi:hypothetical protein